LLGSPLLAKASSKGENEQNNMKMSKELKKLSDANKKGELEKML
jgi:hypothetical protein